jgi:hypothetical protein
MTIHLEETNAVFAETLHNFQHSVPSKSEFEHSSPAVKTKGQEPSVCFRNMMIDMSRP